MNRELDIKSRIAMIADLKACRAQVQQIVEKIEEIQFSHVETMPLGDLRPFLDTAIEMQQELKNWLSQLRQLPE
jgi:hypothetical protein